MKFNIILLLSLAILGTIVFAQTSTPPPEPTNKAPGLKPFTETPPPDTKRKTTSMPTTTSSTTTAPETTTTEKPTTTVAPTTSTTPVTTTAEPNTTTVAPVTTTASPPIPVPEPKIGKWNLSEDGNVCVILNAAIQLKFNYTTTDNVNVTKKYNIPAESSSVVSGTCGNETTNQEIIIQWGKPSSPNSFLCLFSFNSSTHEYSLKEIKVALNTSELPNGKNEVLNLWYTDDLFSVPKGMSYHCTKNQTLNLTAEENSNATIAWAHVSHLQMEAYHKGNSAQFSYAKDCDAIDTPDLVPITVGCALIALVVVVLIAYLVGRRRAQARGYISM